MGVVLIRRVSPDGVARGARRYAAEYRERLDGVTLADGRPSARTAAAKRDAERVLGPLEWRQVEGELDDHRALQWAEVQPGRRPPAREVAKAS